MKKDTIPARAKELLAYTQQLKKSGATWVEGNNSVYGKGGKCAELFPTPTERTAFTKTPQFKQISELLATLAEPAAKKELPRPAATVSGQLRVRMPRSIHAALIDEAEAEGVSLNQLIVSKLAVQLRACV
jgi:hypothetical protein